MKRGLTIGIVFILLTLPLIYAGFFDWIRGDVQKAPQDVSVQVGNSAPNLVINYIDDPITLTPAGTTAVNIIFDVTDDNGISDLDNNAVYIEFTFDSGGEETRTGGFSDCTISDDGGIRTFDCEINMQHYDAYGAWTAYVSIEDISSAVGSDSSGFIVSQLKDISLSPATISFGVVSPGQNDILSSQNTTITNNGNYNIASGDFEVTGEDLIGQINPSEFIPTGNFNSADEGESDVCINGQTLVANTPVSIPNFVLNKGTSGTPLPTREVQHCMDVPTGLSQQEYSTTGYQAWDLKI